MYYLLILVVGLERIVELVLSNRNAEWSLPRAPGNLGDRTTS